MSQALDLVPYRHYLSSSKGPLRERSIFQSFWSERNKAGQEHYDQFPSLLSQDGNTRSPFAALPMVVMVPVSLGSVGLMSLPSQLNCELCGYWKHVIFVCGESLVPKMCSIPSEWIHFSGFQAAHVQGKRIKGHLPHYSLWPLPTRSLDGKYVFGMQRSTDIVLGSTGFGEDRSGFKSWPEHSVTLAKVIILSPVISRTYRAGCREDEIMK